MKQKRMQKALGIVLVALQLALLAPLAPSEAQAAGRPMEKRKLLVTAYYSPLPDQSFYIRGSYAADIRLNGRGTNGADGTQVYTGMLAAPKTYPFGTRINIPGLGVGEVHDRGGAILARNGYDRVDVWMGHGEEGLARALNWGARFVEGEVYFTPHQVQPGLDYAWVNSSLPTRYVNRLNNKPLQNPAVFNKDITETSTDTDVKALQEALTSLGHYNGPVSGVYGPQTTRAVLAFQLEEGVIASKVSAGAGNFGPKTRVALKKKLEGYNDEIIRETKRLEENRTLLAAGLGKDADGDEVRALQRMLWELGYYTGDLHGEYDEATIDAVFEFQKKQGILESEWDKGAGYYGKKTHSALIAAVDRKMEIVKNYPMQMTSWTPAKKELPAIENLTVEGLESEHVALYFDADLVNKKSIQENILNKKFIHDLDLNDKGFEVSRLQDVLIEKGYLAKALNTGYYGYQTQAAVLEFQMEKGLVQSKTDLGAGRFGPGTRKALNAL